MSSSLALRENEPGTGQSSLGLLSPGFTQHGRKGSFASTSNETEPDPHTDIPLSPTHSSITHVAHEHKKHRSSQDHARKDHANPDPDAKEEEEEEETGPAALEADDDVDVGPFEFRPNQLAMLLDPKSLDSLEELGGVQGILHGLGTHATRGLENAGDAGAPVQDPTTSTSSGQDASVPGIVLTAPGGEEADIKSKSQQDVSHGGAYDASIDERKRVYGTNTLPKRDSVTLWQLMWTALKDKVLVRQYVLLG
jgi:Ca2+-transporting ATPase